MLRERQDRRFQSYSADYCRRTIGSEVMFVKQVGYVRSKVLNLNYRSALSLAQDQ